MALPSDQLKVLRLFLRLGGFGNGDANVVIATQVRVIFYPTL